MTKKKGIGKFLAGAAIGAGLGLLFAPQSGKETRKELKAKFDDLLDSVKKLDAQDVKELIEAKIAEIKAELADLDKEKVLAIAKEKATAIKDKTEELVELAKAKGTPLVQKTAEDARAVTVKAIKEVLVKLEKKA